MRAGRHPHHRAAPARDRRRLQAADPVARELRGHLPVGRPGHPSLRRLEGGPAVLPRLICRRLLDLPADRPVPDLNVRQRSEPPRRGHHRISCRRRSDRRGLFRHPRSRWVQWVLIAMEYIGITILAVFCLVAVFGHHAGSVSFSGRWFSWTSLGGVSGLIGASLIAVYMFTAPELPPFSGLAPYRAARSGGRRPECQGGFASQ